MARKGLHPVLKQMTVVLKNGATIQMGSTIQRAMPYVLQKDVTNHPAWTGEEAGLNMEDGRMARFLSKFDGYDVQSEKQKARAQKLKEDES